jgi:aminoglycoside phosphotransferase (APT) family kinase protein
VRSDGGLTAVELRGDTVRRAAGEWTPAVHALLGHLRAVGFEGAPGVLGMDGAGVEVLTFVPGGGPTHADDELARVGERIRAFHAASASFSAPADARWQFMVGAPRDGSVICHNDLSPDNTVYEPTGIPRAFIDWDLAAPAPPIWDVAWAAYRFVPLYDEATCELLGFPTGGQAERLRILCDAYGLDEREDLLPTVCDRIRALYDTARAWANAGKPGWRDVWADTHGEQWLRGLRHVEAQRPVWSRSL